MKTTTFPRLLTITFGVLGLSVSLVRAQSTAATSAIDDARTLAKYDKNKNGKLDADELAAQRADQASAAKSGDLVSLNPFEVKTERDTSYGVLNSNSITRFSTELNKLPVSADIMSEQFMRDVATTTVEELLANYGAGTGAVVASPGGDSNANQPGDYTTSGQVGLRGLAGGTIRRDGFRASQDSTRSTSSFDLEVVEAIRGPQGLLYGDSGAGGLINTRTKQAKFAQENTRFSYRVDQYGSRQGDIDTNWGNDRIAARLSLTHGIRNFRRLFLENNTDGAYLQLALRLPLQSVLRISGKTTENSSIYSTGSSDLGFTNATRDPRHNFALGYLLATGQAGATNPKTGAAYPGGAIANGNLDWSNVDSWSGWAKSDTIRVYNYVSTLDTVWTRWLSSSFAVQYDSSRQFYNPDNGSLLAPNSFNTANPLTTWASRSNFRVDVATKRAWTFRGALLLTNDLFSGRVQSTTLVGYDGEFKGAGRTTTSYFVAGADGKPLLTPGVAGADVFGRVAIPNQFWSVASGPLKKPGVRPRSKNITINNVNYVLDEANPRGPQWVNPLNPLGLSALATNLPGNTALSGNNNNPYADEDENSGFFIANDTGWLNDRLHTLSGWRSSTVFTSRPNVSRTGTVAYTEREFVKHSYNAGVIYALRPWLSPFYSASQTFNPPTTGGTDAYGNLTATNTSGFSQELGLKFNVPRLGLSGSVQYFKAESTNDAFRYPSFIPDIVNPVGLNGAFIGNGGARGQFVNVDKKSSGTEIILTAAPTRNWRVRLAATQSDGRILNGTIEPLFWNDDFYRDSAGRVTYANGAAFMVPTDTAGVAQVNSSNALRAPVVGATNTQLTVAMMSDPASDYYAYGKAGAEAVNGKMLANSIVYRALRWFNQPVGGVNNQAFTGKTGLPVSAIPYRFSDIVGYKGNYIVAGPNEPTIGNALYRVNFTNNYSFTEGRLKGFGIGGTLNMTWQNRTYYYNEPDGKGGFVRTLFKAPAVSPQVNANLSYQRKFGRYGFASQVNVENLFNRYVVGLTPDASTGFSTEANIGVTFYGAPRTYVWTNSITF